MESRFLSPSLKKAKMRPCWANLPGDVLPIIAEKASTTNIQYVHLRAVCKAWRTALTPHPHHLPPQFPWLMLPQPCMFSAHVSFYDIARSKTYEFQLPYMSDKFCCGSSHGWLVLEHQHRVSLLNPLTSRCIDLPSLDYPPTLLREKPVPPDQHDRLPNCIRKASLSCSPSKPGCVVVACFFTSSNWELAFCQIGDSHWTELKKFVGPSVANFTFYNNLVYTVNTAKEISVYDLQDLSVWNIPSKINFCKNIPGPIYLVEGDADSSGPLVVIAHELPRNTVHAYKWCDDQQIWLRVRDIGKRVLFLNAWNSINLQCDDKEENKVYYNVRRKTMESSFRVGFNRANLETGEVVPHKPSPMGVFLFSLICRIPLWVTPSLI